MPVLVGFQAFCPASCFVMCDTDVAPQSGTFHTRGRYEQLYKNYSGSNDGLNTQCDNEKSGNMLKRHFKQK